MAYPLAALTAGLAGAGALTTIHETALRTVPDAPRMDVLGMRAIAASAHAVGARPPARLHEAAMIGDLVSNGLYYSLAGWGEPGHGWLRGAALGLAAGAGAVLLPGPLGLGRAPSNRTAATQAMTVAWYFLGGLTAGVVFDALARPRPTDRRPTPLPPAR